MVDSRLFEAATHVCQAYSDVATAACEVAESGPLSVHCF